MGQTASFSMDLTALKNGIKDLDKKGKRAIADQMQKDTKTIEDYMKVNAPWQNRTWAARKNLKAEFSQETSKMVITLSQNVPYGKYLELYMGKRFAIIYPTIKIKGPEVMKNLRGVFDNA